MYVSTDCRFNGGIGKLTYEALRIMLQTRLFKTGRNNLFKIHAYVSPFLNSEEMALLPMVSTTCFDAAVSFKVIIGKNCEWYIEPFSKSKAM